ncbi:MAG: hypothetical protein ACC645_25770, partial [Pirellulales bacterium]
VIVCLLCHHAAAGVIVPYCLTADTKKPPDDNDIRTWSVYYTDEREEVDAQRDAKLLVGPDGRRQFALWVRIPAGTVLADTGQIKIRGRGSITVERIAPEPYPCPRREGRPHSCQASVFLR